MTDRSTAPSTWLQTKPPSICIIGAGISGLRCAEILLKQGFGVTIIEGRDRVGGRVHQRLHGGNLIDMGPNWIHGTDGNPVLDLAKETHTVTASTDELSATFTSKGERMSAARSEEISNLMWGIVADAFKYSNETRSIPTSMSLQDYFRQKVEEKGIPEPDKEAVLHMAEIWGAFIGSPFQYQSLKYFWLEECIDGENLFVASTYKSILDRVAKTAIEDADIRLNTIVMEVSHRPEQNGAIEVKTSSDAQAEVFDAVVLTASLGCLKSNSPPIVPPLPARMRTAIGNISYGNLEKVYISFASAFWDSLPADRLPMFTHFLHPTYAGVQNSDASTVEALSLSALPSSEAHPTILFYIHGSFAKSVVESVDGLDPQDPAYLSALTKRFMPYIELLPNFSAENSECVPIAACATMWSVDKLAGYGSYSNFQVPHNNDSSSDTDGDERKLDEDIEVLRQGCPERSLWLAGEHTAPFVALGTVTGAYWSGQNVADKLIERFQDTKDGVPLTDENETHDDQHTSTTIQVGKGTQPSLGNISFEQKTVQ